MKLKLKAVALFSLALGTDHYFFLDIFGGFLLTQSLTEISAFP